MIKIRTQIGTKSIEFYSHFFRIPFKWMPPFGYLLVWLIEILSVFCVLFVLVPMMSTAIGSCWMIIAFIKDILNELTKLNSVCRATHKNLWELKKRLCNIVQLYSETKELRPKFRFCFRFFKFFQKIEICFFLFRFISKFNATCEFSILTVFAYTLLSISTSLFTVVSQLVGVFFSNYFPTV